MNPSRRHWLLGAGIILAVLLLGAFVMVDFQAMRSATATESSTGTSQLDNATAPENEPLTLVVLEDGAMAEGLAPELEAALSNRFGVSTTTEPTPPWTGTVLVISVTESSVQYNPITPAGRVSADFAFVGSGNATFATTLVTGDDPLVVTNAEPYVVHGTVSVTDRSRGIVSLPGYRSHLRSALAAELSRTLGSAPGMG